MATETQLRDLLVELEAGAPTVHDVLDGLPFDRTPAPRPLRARRRNWAVTGAIAACAAVIVGVGALAASTSSHHATTGPAAGSAALRAQLLPAWHAAVGPVPGYIVARDSIVRLDPVTSQGQQSTIRSATSRVTGDLEVSLPAPGQSVHGVGNWTSVASDDSGPRRALTINGRRAYYVLPTALTRHELRAHPGNPWAAAAENINNQPQLYWQLPGHAIVEASGTFGFRPATATWNGPAALATLKQFAAATTYAAHAPVDVPFRLAADPHGFIPLGVTVQAHSQCIGYGTGRQQRPSDPTWNWYDVCRYPSSAPVSQLETGALVATRTLSDGTTLGLLTGGWPGQRTPISRSAGRSILRAADVSPLTDDRSTWLPIR